MVKSSERAAVYRDWLAKLVPHQSIHLMADSTHWVVPDTTMQILAEKGMHGVNCDAAKHHRSLARLHTQLTETRLGLAHLMAAVKATGIHEQNTTLADAVKEGERLMGLPDMPAPAPVSEAEVSTPVYDALDKVGLSTSARNTLYRADIRRVSHLMTLRHKDLMGVRGLGPMLYREIRTKLTALGYITPDNPGPFLVWPDGQWADEPEE